MTMSHSITIRTQTVSSSSTPVFINTGYLKTWSGFFKLLQLALGTVCVGIVADDVQKYYVDVPKQFFLLMATTFLIGTFILFVSCLASVSTSSLIPKTIYELLYHAIAFALYLAASITFIVTVSDNRSSRRYELLMAAAICGLVNSVLYFLCTVIALRTYKGF